MLMEGQELLSFLVGGGGKKPMCCLLCIFRRDFLTPCTAIVLGMKTIPAPACLAVMTALLSLCLDLWSLQSENKFSVSMTCWCIHNAVMYRAANSINMFTHTAGCTYLNYLLGASSCRGSGACPPPRKVLNLRPSEITSGAFPDHFWFSNDMRWPYTWNRKSRRIAVWVKNSTFSLCTA